MNRHRGVQDYQARPAASLGPLFDAAEEAARRDEGIERATGASSPIWRELAYRTLVDLAREQPTVHVDDYYPRLTWREGHPNAMGGLWLRAIREGVLDGEPIAYEPTALPGKHRHKSPRYRSLVYGQREVAA